MKIGVFRDLIDQLTIGILELILDDQGTERQPQGLGLRCRYDWAIDSRIWPPSRPRRPDPLR